MPSMVEVKCSCGCGRTKRVRTADRKRGWGKYFSKSCKAKHQSRKHKSAGKPISKEQRYRYLCEALEDGRITEEYFNATALDEYPEFLSQDDRISAEMDNEFGSFGSEEAVQGGW